MKPSATLEKTTRQPGWQRIILLAILGYEAAGGTLGGVLLIMSPDGQLMSMPVDILHGVFRDFLFPGIILLGLAVLSAFSFASVLRRSTADWFMAGLALGGWVIWFIVEIIILQELHWLHLMWGLPVLLAWLFLIPLIALRNPTVTMQKTLLACGILSSLWYVAINVYVPTQYEGYSLSALTVSELSAIGAPTRQMWVLLAIFYPLAFGAFGWGLLQSAQAILPDRKPNHFLRIVGIMIIAYSVFNLYWPPMHQRGLEPTLTDTLHITWAMITVGIMIVMMGFGAAAFGIGFRIYTIMSIAMLVIYGILTSLQAPNIPTNGPTPMMGVFERVNIALFLQWIVVLAVVVLAKEKEPAQFRVQSPQPA